MQAYGYICQTFLHNKNHQAVFWNFVWRNVWRPSKCSRTATIVILSFTINTIKRFFGTLCEGKFDAQLNAAVRLELSIIPSQQEPESGFLELAVCKCSPTNERWLLLFQTGNGNAIMVSSILNFWHREIYGILNYPGTIACLYDLRVNTLTSIETLLLQ